MTDHIVQIRKLKPDGAGLTGPPLTYRYGTPLEEGDVVLCPGNEFSGPFRAQVVELGSDYQGYTKSVLCRIAPDRAPHQPDWLTEATIQARMPRT